MKGEIMLYTDNRQNKIEVNEELINIINEVCEKALKAEEVNIPYQISLLFVDNEEIRDINRETRGIDKATDVLSFPMLDYPKDKVFKEVYKETKFNEIYLDGEELVLGDMVLSLERAKEQSIEYNHSFNREVCYLVVHSILHLLGYDHMEDEEKKRMRKREEEILGDLNITR
jgi:probable rRNA maturation factor